MSGLAEGRAALYIRLSKEDEGEGMSASVANQRSMLCEYASRHGLCVHDIYIDDGWSGTSFDRPAFQRLLADIEAKRVDTVITKDLSRLGRDYIMTGHYMERYFPEHRVRYISLLDGIDTGVESSANDITPFRAIMNDMYAKDISKKIRSVKHDKQRKGEFIGGKGAYGYKKHPEDKNRLVIDEAAAAVVRRIFAMALAGGSCRRIAAELNAEGVPPPAVYAGLSHGKTGAWSGERISELLRNETYIGNMVQGRSVKASYKIKKCVRQPPEKWVVVENTHEPIIDAETFSAVGALIKSRYSTRSRTYDFPLKGLIFCHECGRPLGVLNRKNAAGEDVLYFVCRTYQRSTKAGLCTSHTVRESAVTKAVRQRVREVCGRYLDPAALLPAAMEAVSRARAKEKNASESAALENKLDALSSKLERMYMDRLNGLIEEGDFSRLYVKLRRERTELSERWLAAREEDPVPVEDAARDIAESFVKYAPESRETLVGLVERVELTAEREIIIYFRFQQEGAIFQ